MNYFKEENRILKENFNLDEILKFQLMHDIQIIRGADYQYSCWIDKKAYGSSLTPLFALYSGIQAYKNCIKNGKRT